MDGDEVLDTKAEVLKFTPEEIADAADDLDPVGAIALMAQMFATVGSGGW